MPTGAAKGAKAFLKKHLCPSALETVPVEMHISMATMPAASLRLLLCSLCGDAMGRFASAMKVRGAFDLGKLNSVALTGILNL